MRCNRGDACATAQRPGNPDRGAAGLLRIMLDAVVVKVALPTLAHDLGAGVDGLQWVVDGYTLMFGALLLSAGALVDRIGARRAFVRRRTGGGRFRRIAGAGVQFHDGAADQLAAGIWRRVGYRDHGNAPSAGRRPGCWRARRRPGCLPRNASNRMSIHGNKNLTDRSCSSARYFSRCCRMAAVELAAPEWVVWSNHPRLLEPIDRIPPTAAEANDFRQLARRPTAGI